MDEVALHVNPIGYSEIRFLLEKSGFEIEKTYLDKPKRNSLLFLPTDLDYSAHSAFFISRKTQNALD